MEVRRAATSTTTGQAARVAANLTRSLLRVAATVVEVTAEAHHAVPGSSVRQPTTGV